MLGWWTLCLGHVSRHVWDAVSYTHLDVYKRQILSTYWLSNCIFIHNLSSLDLFCALSVMLIWIFVIGFYFILHQILLKWMHNFRAIVVQQWLITKLCKFRFSKVENFSSYYTSLLSIKFLYFIIIFIFHLVTKFHFILLFLTPCL